MNFIIGFGSIEQNFEQDEEDAIRRYVVATAKEMGLDYFSSEFVERVAKWVDERGKSYRDKDDEYRDAPDHPDRYSYYWASIADNASNIVVIIKFSHINRRHAMSPDGWALLQTKRLIHIESWDLRESARAA